MSRVFCYGLAFLTQSLGRAVTACPMLFVVILLIGGGGLYFDSGSFAYAFQGALLLAFGLGLVLILSSNVIGFAIIIPLILLDQWTGMLTPKWLDDQQAAASVPGVWSHVWTYVWAHLTSPHMLILLGGGTAVLLVKWVWKASARPNPMDSYVRPTYRD